MGEAGFAGDEGADPFGLGWDGWGFGGVDGGQQFFCCPMAEGEVGAEAAFFDELAPPGLVGDDRGDDEGQL